jgi:hypothetical protein
MAVLWLEFIPITALVSWYVADLGVELIVRALMGPSLFT